MKPVVGIVNTRDILLGSELVELGQLVDHARSDFLVGRAALKLAGRKYLQRGHGADPGEVVIGKLQDGRPYIESHDHLFCSIAHSRSWGIAAVGPRKVGVDVERVEPRDGSLLDHVASPQEVEHVWNYFDRGIDEITIIWTIKESVLKGLGLGLDMNPRQVRITDKKDRDGIEVKTAATGSPVWQVRSFRLEDYYFSVAYEKE